MPFENATNIAELIDTWPVSNDVNIVADPEAMGDEHTRNIKLVLKNIFLGTGGSGFNIPITAFEDELNFLTGLTSDIQTQINNAGGGLIPVGGIIEYFGSDLTAIPASYAICNGTNGTPDLLDLFVYGTNTESEVGLVGGEPDTLDITHSHSDTHGHAGSNSNSGGAHVHSIPSVASSGSGGLRVSGSGTIAATVTTSANGNHTHPVTIDPNSADTSTTGVSGVGLNIPPFYRMVYIQRIL